MAWELPRRIRTRRLVLRQLQASDEGQIFTLFNNWEVIRWLGPPPWPYSRADAANFLQRILTPTGEQSEAAFAITLDDTLIGGIGVRVRPANPAQSRAGPFLGYWLGQPYWGRGYMTEAAGALIPQVFTTMPHDAIYSGAFKGNDGSLRVQEKLGFVRDGEAMVYSTPRGGEFPHINTVLTRARFATLGEVTRQ
jgi:RimJ/RimL family protein N-acetyltransferase